MTNRKTTRRALVLSLLSLLLCCSMLVGTTFAWFTDSVQTGNNKIVAGNLDVELYNDRQINEAKKVGVDTALFEEVKLWEPGVVAYENLTVANVGTLALKYELSVNFLNENDLNGNKLSQVLKVGLVKGGIEDNATREEAVAAVKEWQPMVSFSWEGTLEAGKTAEPVALVIYWEPSAEDNKWNANNGQKVSDFDATQKNELHIDLGIELFATQLMSEEDSFGNDYDKEAPEVTVEVTPANIQEYLDGQHGDLTNMTLQLTPGDYGVLYLGRPTKYAGSNTEYTCDTHEFVTDDAEAFKAHMAETGYHTTPKYTTALKNLTIQGVSGATVAGVLVTTGHSYGDVYDYVLDKDYDSGSAYYSTLTMKNIAFKNVAFSGKVDINTSDADTVYDGVTFDGCSFTTGGTASANGAALRYYNEANNGKVRNLTVKNSTFTNVYQGIYAHHVSGVTVTGNTFDTTGHNAIALQNHDGAIDLKKVVISNNKFNKVGDRVVRFGDIGADSDITMEYNIATNSGDEDSEVVKATDIAAGVEVTASYNSWGGTVVNPELLDTKTGNLAADASGFKAAATDADSTGTIVMTDDIAVEDLTYVNFARDTVVNGNGNSLVRDTASGNPLLVNTTNKVTFENVVFESTKGSAVLATRKEGANIEVNDCTFDNKAAPSTGSTGVQVYASNVTMTFNRCTFNNMPVITNSSYPEGIKLVFNDCTFNWEGDNCSGFIQIANNLKITVDLNNCKMNYTTSSQYTTAKTMISYNWPDACTININGLTVIGTRNNEKIWKICSSNNAVTINTTGELSYTFNGAAVDFTTYLK